MKKQKQFQPFIGSEVVVIDWITYYMSLGFNAKGAAMMYLTRWRPQS